MKFKNPFTVEAEVLATVVLALLVVTGALFRTAKARDTYKRDVDILLGQVDTFRTRSQALAASNGMLELKLSDFQRVMAEDAATIKSLKARNEKLSSMVKTQGESEVRFVTVVKDSIVYRDRVLDTLRVIRWEDQPWCEFEAEVKGDCIHARMVHRESLQVAVFLEYKRFLFWNTKVKGCNVKVVSENPYTTELNVSGVKIL